MYGQIGVDEWGFIPRKYREYDAEENSLSDWLHLNTVERLKSVAQENHPILLRIRDRERKIERLSSNYPASEEDVPEKERRPTMVTLLDERICSKKPTVYVETSVVSYLTSRLSNNVLKLSRQQATRHLWDEYSDYFEFIVSDLVVTEIKRGDESVVQHQQKHGQMLNIFQLQR